MRDCFGGPRSVPSYRIRRTHRTHPLKNQDAYGLTDIALGENNEWNELHYVSWETFAQMAPSVLKLEISRLGRMADQLSLADERRNVLVSARYRLGLLRDLVMGDFENADLESCDEHLRTVILSLGFRPDASDRLSVSGTTAVADAGFDNHLDNIADRLGYVRERLRRLR